jgi:hypothetical protein
MSISTRRFQDVDPSSCCPQAGRMRAEARAQAVQEQEQMPLPNFDRYDLTQYLTWLV